MSPTFLQLIPFCLGLFFLQGLACIPWLVIATRLPLSRNLGFYGKIVASVTLAGLFFAFLIQGNSDPDTVVIWGRTLGSLFTLQLGLDVFVMTFFLLLKYWPRGGAVTLAAFQEGIRQPMFWMLTMAGALFMQLSIVIPYFTFGEDIKMVTEISFALTMMLPAIFGVISASISVSEEIEGRTAVTLLSKPITRRDFLLGKFLGITLAGILMTMFLGWVLVWVVLEKTNYDFRPGISQLAPDAPWITSMLESTYGRSVSGDLLRGIGLWLSDGLDALPSLIIGYGQVLTLVAISVALATRVPMIVNMTMCLVVYLLGHLTPIMTEVSKIELVRFIAQLFELLLPGLDLFDVGTAIIRDVPLDPKGYAIYTLNVALYALMYTSIAILVGLILFEDRDVA